jgi:mono/diheme cytochrome c family protein
MACHGENATGGIGPALNSQQFLGSASDDQIRSIISTGIPGSQMSSYLQEFGGPLTADEIHSIVGYLRSLEENAPDRPDWRDMLYGSTTTTAAG